MGIENRSLIFDNLLVYETSQLKADWQEPYFMMEDFILAEEIYKNGPVFFSVAPVENEEKFGHFTYFLPINAPVLLEDNQDFYFQSKLGIEEALCLRQADQELDFYAAYQKVKEYAVAHSIEIAETFYCVLLDVYGEMIIDLYVPIKEWRE
ncbi:hypothetical protein [Bacillus marasmi]|uniref:hypothetical protein n=1 Tax=Bacillus marasmi TaxID=1926279 RepID=UPI0011C852E7|nr:hypothetical protein [Bacillus marasmi]